MVLLSIQIVPVPTTMNNFVASLLLNNIVETMLNNIFGPTMLLTSDNNIVQELFWKQHVRFLHVR